MSSEFSVIHQAIFGDVKGAHNLVIASDGASDRVLSDLASRYTDRVLPADLPWREYTCGFPLYEQYILTRTFPVQASRSGMVQTHAVIIPLAHVSDYDLDKLFELLPTQSVTPPSSLSRLTSAGLNSVGHDLPVPPGYPSVIRALIQGVVPVWIGENGFGPVVSFLWRHLWPAARRNFRFRVSSEPNDLADSPATLVWTPPGLRTNWNEQHFVNQSLLTLDGPSMSEAYLMSMPEGQPIADLLQRLSIQPATIPELKRYEQYVRMSEADSADSIRVALRLLIAIAPRFDELRDEKKNLLERLAVKTADGSEADVLALRNLDVAGIDQGTVAIEKAIADWLRLRLKESKNAIVFAREAFLVDQAWKPIALGAASQVFNSWTYRHAKLLWHWWENDSALISPCEMLLPTSDQVEQDLIATIPQTIRTDLLEPVLSLAARRSWFSLHAAAIYIAPDLEMREKFKRQLDIEPPASDQAGLRLLADKVNDSEIVTAAVELREDRLVDLAGQAVARRPELLINIDVANSAWLRIWSKSIVYGAKPLSGFLNPPEIAHRIMDAVVSGSSVPLEVVEGVVSEPESDLASYPKRRNLWALLPQTIRDQALTTTAQIWLTRFLVDDTYDPEPLEDELETAAIRTWRAAPESTPAGKISSLWARFKTLRESDFLRWLDAYNTQLTTFESVAIGSLVVQHGWSDSAARFVRLLQNGRKDIAPAITESKSLLGLVDRLYVSLFLPSAIIGIDEWWNGWLDLSSALYPRGVEDNGIWLEADGDLSRIKRATGREEWVEALDLLRKGGAGGTMTIEGLLHEMRKDFPGNQQLELLETTYLRKLRS